MPNHTHTVKKNKINGASEQKGYLKKRDQPTYPSVLCATDSAMQLSFCLMILLSILWMTVLKPAVCKANPISCRLWTDPQLAGIFMNGDFVIGGIFSIHYYTRSEQNTYTWQPSQLQCSGRSVSGFDRKLLICKFDIFQKISKNIKLGNIDYCFVEASFFVLTAWISERCDSHVPCSSASTRSTTEQISSQASR